MQMSSAIIPHSNGADEPVTLMLTGYGICAGKRLEEWIEREFDAATFSTKMKLPLDILPDDRREKIPVRAGL